MNCGEQYNKVVKRIVRALSEIGYEHFFDDATSREMAGGVDSPVGASDMYVIPGSGPLRPAEMVLALSRRGRRGASLSNVLAQINEVLSAAVERAAPDRRRAD